MFIELTTIDRERTFNLNHVSDFSENTVDGGCSLIMSDGTRVKVKESYKMVKELIKNEVAAERGY